MFRMSSRHFIHLEQYSMHLLVRSFLHGNQQQILYVRLLKTTSFHTTHCLQHTQYVRIMATSLVSTTHAHTVARQQRFTAVSLVTIVQYRTGTKERLRNTRTVSFTILQVLYAAVLEKSRQQRLNSLKSTLR